MDALRVCLRLGAETVSCLYRRSRAEAPARVEEIHHAGEEGVQFHWLVSPVEILDDGNKGVRAVRCVRMTLVSPTSPAPPSGAGAGSEFEIEADMVVYAIGTNANRSSARPRSSSSTSAATSHRRRPRDLHPGVYAGGDIVTGAATVIQAMGQAVAPRAA